MREREREWRGRTREKREEERRESECFVVGREKREIKGVFFVYVYRCGVYLCELPGLSEVVVVLDGPVRDERRAHLAESVAHLVQRIVGQALAYHLR